MSEPIISEIIGGIVAGVGWIWIVIIAFRESKFQGLLCVFIPPYAIYYGIKRWSDAKKPLVIASVGIVLLIVGIVYGLPGMEVENINFGESMRMAENVKQVIAEFMEAGAERNIDAAYACWSPESATEEDIAEYIESNYDDLFAGYERLTIEQLGGHSIGGGGIDSCHAKGDIIYTYNGGKRLLFEAWLMKENDVWKITDIQIGSTALFFT